MPYAKDARRVVKPTSTSARTRKLGVGANARPALAYGAALTTDVALASKPSGLAAVSLSETTATPTSVVGDHVAFRDAYESSPR